MTINPSNNYKDTQPFRAWCQKVLPLVYDDSLSYYELLCKLLDAVNLNTENNQLLIDDMQNLYNYVNNYFDNLDVQNEINNKLDEMVTSGQLDYLFQKYLDPKLEEQNEKIDNAVNEQNEKIKTLEERMDTFTSLPDGSTAGDAELEDIRIWFNGNTSENAGGATRGQSKFIYDKLNKYISQINQFSKCDFDIDNMITKGTYISVDYTLQKHTDSAILSIPCNENFILGFELGKKTNVLCGYYDSNNACVQGNLMAILRNPTDTKNLINFCKKNDIKDKNKYYVYVPKNELAKNFIVNLKIIGYDLIESEIEIYKVDDFFSELTQCQIANVQYSGYDVKTNVDNLDKNAVTYRGYINISNDGNDGQLVGSGGDKLYTGIIKLNNVKNINIYYKTIGGTRQNMIVGFYDNNMSPTRVNKNNPTQVYLNGEQYDKFEFTIENEEIYMGYNYMFNYGDSNGVLREVIITENPVETFVITEIAKAKVNSGNELLNNLNWYAIGDSITEKNFRALYNYVDYCVEDLGIKAINLGVSGTGYMKTENTFTKRLDQINSYNVETDIITVMGSVNDINYVPDQLGQFGDKTSDTLYGSIYLFFDTLFKKFIGCRIGVITPTQWGHSNIDDNTKKYIKAIKETAEYFNVPILDLTNTGNLNPWFEGVKEKYFKSDGIGSSGQIDDVHPNSLGHKLFYARVRNFLMSL